MTKVANINETAILNYRIGTLPEDNYICALCISMLVKKNLYVNSKKG